MNVCPSVFLARHCAASFLSDKLLKGIGLSKNERRRALFGVADEALSRAGIEELGGSFLSKQTVYKPDLMHKKQTKDEAKGAGRGAEVAVKTPEAVCRISQRYG